ncbi:MAG: glycosyltransferase [Chloroflexi bacterium HGW-Chloroflexi-6]|nr:MAG: glycosyltransferase [Chloroflexi bacterium HGW-Chloroflexi-6]
MFTLSGSKKLHQKVIMPEVALVSLVIPVYNETGVIETTHAKIVAALDGLPYDFLIYYVDDGSTDGTDAALAAIAAQDGRVRVLTLSRNFGHQAALTAGLDQAEGDIVISLDGDGQHPALMIPEMIDLVRQGYDIVQAQRIEEGDGLSFKKITSGAFYTLINKISGTRIQPGAADFRALSRQALDALKSMPEYHRFLRGMIAWMGFKSVVLPYHEEKRMAGRSKYSLAKMVRLASDAVFSFSLMPLYIGLSAGGVFIFLAAAQIIYVLFLWLTGQYDKIVPGWSSLMAVMLIASGIVMILLGFIGVYVGYIFQEVKHRPKYILKK